MRLRKKHVALAVAGALAATGAIAADGVSYKELADALHVVMDSDRTVYTRMIVNRLQNEEKVIKASEHWKDEKALVLPAQMFRMGAEMVAEKQKDFTYSLLSEWPVNKQNAPRTPVEIAGLKAVAGNKQPFYKEETIGGKKYFTAVYPDIAISPACVSCHNGHKDTPRSDFKQGDVMGGVVLRIAMK
jgi:hypothetical protein